MNTNRAQIPVEFFSFGYRLSGTFDARKRSLGDVVYDTTTAYLTIQDAYISPVTRPAEISANYPKALIIKAELTFVLTMDKNVALRRDQQYGSYLGPQLKSVFITLPFFEIRGELRMPGRLDPRVLLSSQTERFITLMDVTARTTSNPEITYEGATGIVNKSKISFIGM
ncbi:MAG: hypothetical protein ACP5HM_01485 [Anaerolineae bacterium]